MLNSVAAELPVGFSRLSKRLVFAILFSILKLRTCLQQCADCIQPHRTCEFLVLAGILLFAHSFLLFPLLSISMMVQYYSYWLIDIVPGVEEGDIKL